MRALISVSAKEHIAEFARALQALGVELISTGNTAQALQQAGLSVQTVSDVTGFPEILDGRVKTLHPAVHGGILARRDLPEHLAALDQHNIVPIDIVVVNLYPFVQTITRPGVIIGEAVEQIDVGGPAMVRAAAKNHQHVLVVVDPADYAVVIEALQQQNVSGELRQRLAAKAFAHTSSYDAAIAGYLGAQTLPETLNVSFRKIQPLRYGENPHQIAALYGDFFKYFTQLHGKELSYINILDIAAAQELIEEWPPAAGCALAIIKHTNPCGVGLGDTPLEAWQRAFETDREAPFGGVIVLNQPLDLALAQRIDELFSEIVIAPDFTLDALDLLRNKKNRRLMRLVAPVAAAHDLMLHSVPGGVLAQEWDRAPLAGEQWRVVSRRAPTAEEQRAMHFGWRVVKHVKSNAIVYAAAERTLGIGAGQMSRVDSSRVAVEKAGRAELSLHGAVVASDALFPFPDGVEVAAAAGATAVIQPGGSLRDEDVIAAADRLGLAMVFTGRRHFRH
ncbi:MAG: bifunctional phosphoribosylaminoimidazolecarboxamide formyltransferase/IMP cyclohydrolase [Roseiflexaceae bacterium]|nr:bifunctional phosphoribosylaminoimidazolecarboxamide formyltransferase/IMP cyclohydrolase [Roseiflexaceae bacterium]